MERLTKIELEDYCENAGLTQLQQDILRLRYFDKREMTIVAICLELNISSNKYEYNRKRMLNQIYKYDRLKEKKNAENGIDK